MPADIYNHTGRPYEVRVTGYNSQYDERGESVYYLEAPHYKHK